MAQANQQTDRQTDRHAHTRVLQCSHASVGLTQARPNNLPFDLHISPHAQVMHPHHKVKLIHPHVWSCTRVLVTVSKGDTDRASYARIVSWNTDLSRRLL